MQINTRNFLLYLLAVAFLVVGIFSTVISDLRSSKVNVASVLVGVDNGRENYEAAVIDSNELNRAEKLATLRSKIKELGSSFFAEVPSEIVEQADLGDTDEVEEENKQAVILCKDYMTYSKQWSTEDLTFAVVEGARIIYREQSLSGTTTLEVGRDLVLQLPLLTMQSGLKSCLPHDVVAIGLDGSLIRNSEYSIYSVFGQETLIGYALDGFPLYGRANVVLDDCGGIFEGGQYRYYLSEKNDVILNCYAGLPVEL